MDIGDECPACETGHMQHVDPAPKPGDKLVCSSLACDFEDVLKSE